MYFVYLITGQKRNYAFNTLLPWTKGGDECYLHCITVQNVKLWDNTLNFPANLRMDSF